MAKTVNKDEQAIKDKVTLLKKQIGDKTPTVAQVAALKEMRNSLGQLVFVRVANKRIPKVLKVIAGIGSLSGSNYNSSEAQRKAIATALQTAVDDASAKLQGKKESFSGFQLPTN